ncbi:MAG: hypothetical protein HY741_09845 [Chloroflexi bacterium]|nr:hypothetical protein [Chloroflexota bacterium]
MAEMKTQDPALPPLGDEAFEMLKAEAETEWLDAILIEHPQLARMMIMHSLLVLGERGSGKTALRHALVQKSATLPKNRPLVVVWTPDLPQGNLSETEIVRAYMDQIIAACAVALLQHIAKNYIVFNAAPLHLRETLCAILQRYLPGDPELRLYEIEGQVSAEGLAFAKDALTRPPRSLLKADASQQTIIRMLAECVRAIGLSRIWIVADQLEEWFDLEMQAMAESLHSLMKSLALFEIAGFEFKLIAPREFEKYLMQPSALTIRRMSGFPLEWDPEQLVLLVERRLAAAFGKREFPLKKLAPGKSLLGYLSEYGGKFPRGWLELIRPLAQAYLRREMQRPFTEQEFQELRQENPLPLRHDPHTGAFMLHYKPLKLTEQPLKLLSLLYQRRVCTRSELWYLALREFDQVPHREGDKNWEEPSVWRGNFDTTLYRLRDQVEPNAKAPIYIVSADHGKIVLKNAL